MYIVSLKPTGILLLIVANTVQMTMSKMGYDNVANILSDIKVLHAT